jgi:hypothetical protein
MKRAKLPRRKRAPSRGDLVEAGFVAGTLCRMPGQRVVLVYLQVHSDELVEACASFLVYHLYVLVVFLHSWRWSNR